MYKELEEVLRYISQKIDEHDLITLHTNLATYYTTARTAPTPENTEQIKSTRDEILEAQENIEPHDWDYIRNKTFLGFGGTSVLGISGYNRLMREIENLNNDPEGASTVVKNFASEIHNVKTRAEQTVNNLEPLFAGGEQVPPGKKVIQLVFEQDVVIDGFEAMQQQAKDWATIMKVFKNMVPTAKADVEIWRIYKASPAVIILVAPTDMILAIGAVTFLALQIVEKLYTIRHLQLTVKKAELDLGNKPTTEIGNILAATEEAQLETLIEEKVTEAMNKFLPSQAEAENNVAKNAVRHNVKKIYNFVVKGGNVNLIDGDLDGKDGETKVTQKTLNSTYNKLKELSEAKAPLQLASFTREEKEAAETFKVEELNTINKPKTKAKKSRKEKLPQQ